MDEPGSAFGEEGLDTVPSRFCSDEFYRALAARPRRRVLFYLLEHGEGTVDRLADMLYGWTTVVDNPSGSDEVDQFRSSLYHNHLPQLQKGGLVEFDPDEEQVTLTELHESVRNLIRLSIEAEGEQRVPWEA